MKENNTLAKKSGEAITMPSKAPVPSTSASVPTDVAGPHESSNRAVSVPFRRIDMRYAIAIAMVGLLTLLVTIALVTSRLGFNTNAAESQTSPATNTYSDFTGSAPIEGTKPAPQFGIVVDQNMRVVDLEAGGAAELAGIQRGDIVVQLDGLPVSLPANARQIAADIIKSHPGKDVTVTINRKGQTIAVNVLPAPRPDKGGSPDQPVPTVTPVLDPYSYF